MLATIQKGDTGDIVKIAQYLVNYSPANGKFDEAFEKFIENWQIKKDVYPVNKIIDKNTWHRITQLLPTCSTSKNKKSSYTYALQMLIGGITVDGIYGNNTKKAVATYQSAANLTADGVCGQKTWNSLIIKDIVTKTETKSTTITTTTNASVNVSPIIKQPVDYKQYDSRWGKIKYSTHTSSQTISNSGCGPTAMADIVATWWDKSFTPKEACALSVANGYRTYDNGTAWGYFKFCANKFKAYKFIQTTSVATLKNALQEGAYAVVSFKQSKWTNGGHFCCIWKWDGNYFYINDPASAAANRAKGTETEVTNARKQFFIFYNDPIEVTPKKEEEEKVEEKNSTKITNSSSEEVQDGTIPTGNIIDDEHPATPYKDPISDEELQNLPELTDEDYKIAPNPNLNYNKDGAIIDISKWQGTIDFKKLAPKVAFIIARAGVGSDPDPKFDSYAAEMIKYKIPFGVYCYSYAGTVEKAEEEALNFYERASKYNPLFYVMDAEEEKITHNAIEAFADQLRMLKAPKIGCYVAHNRYNQYNYKDLASLFDFTWIPRYGSNTGSINGSKKPSYTCDLWQFTSAGKINGISGNVDLNTITGQGHNLDWFWNLKIDAVG